MKTPAMKTLGAVVTATAVLLVLGACSTEEQMRAVDPAGQSDTDTGTSTSSGGAMPTALPAAEGEVSTGGLVTVLDDGEGPELCHAVAESFPPQCSGVPMAGWTWADHPEHEDESGVKWGDFALTGTFDGTTFTVTDAIPAALYDALNEEPEPLPGTPCEPPAGGWAVVDAAKATPEAMDATFTEAARLPGFAGTWMDQSQDPSATNDPTKVIINVAVTEDVEGAEATLRDTWGGALCVSPARYTEAELNEISMELQSLPGVLTTSGAADVVQAEVLHDDGSLQAWADEEYGEGRVEITSALQPVEG
ncbi:hypothetical protein [Nocardioides terrigena]|uniref:hypothetical protein n=1 Tax=Nocardioides terrigena TaxID=424797 RepID=UPI000D32792C|nr:hypothetical protein [Nocardioides terrigena]